MTRCCCDEDSPAKETSNSVLLNLLDVRFTVRTNSLRFPTSPLCSSHIPFYIPKHTEITNMFLRAKQVRIRSESAYVEAGDGEKGNPGGIKEESEGGRRFAEDEEEMIGGIGEA